MVEENVRGDEIDTITTIGTFEKIMLELFKGYPVYRYFGILEYYFGKGANEIMNVLKDDELIEIYENKKLNRLEYRLKERGLNFSITMRNWRNSKEMLRYTKTIRNLTWIITGVSVLTLISIIFSTSFGQEIIKIVFSRSFIEALIKIKSFL